MALSRTAGRWLLPWLLFLILPTLAAARIGLGIDTLKSRDFDVLQGKRVGLLTHPAGVNRFGTSTIDVLRQAPGVNLVALFGPEHGIYGDEKANEDIQDRTDRRTGLPVYSLYGKYRRPSPEMLDRIDVMVIDLQDLGVRSYTYVSAMRYTMEACFEAGTEVVVLDRPNPLGGLKVDGPMLDKGLESYVGAFPVPYVHGLTIGELARMAKDQPGVLQVSDEVRQRGRLTIVPMTGWRRSMMWPQTELAWVPTSPAIPDLSAAMGYSMTGLGCQLGGFKHGFGSQYPFRVLQFSGKTPEEIEAALEARRIPGVEFRVVPFDVKGKPHRGVYVLVTDWQTVRPTELSFHLMTIAAGWSRGNPFRAAPDSQQLLFNKHVGSYAWWEELEQKGAQADVRGFVNRWTQQAKAFQQQSRRWWLYE
ncbi:MAG: DUF1343 domain-containing protein [Verrucomicrobiota bacterium JB022]|nr:DUF1343 domain-containing protein [Verrucomicrobiota bacterium JB022]